MKQNKKKKILVSILVLGILMITLGVSSAFYIYVKKGTTSNSLKFGHLSFQYDELNNQKDNFISIGNALPVSDEEGKQQSSSGYFEFQIRATTKGAPISYEIYLTKNEESTLPEKAVKTYLSTLPNLEGDISTESAILNTGTHQDINVYNKLWTSQVPPVEWEENGKTLYQETIPIDQENYEKNYRFRMWIDQDANQVDENGRWIYSNMTFSVNVNVYASNEELPEPLPPEDGATLVSGSNWFSPSSSGITIKQVTRVEFVKNMKEPINTIDSWDVSSKSNGSIMAFLTKNSDGDDTYTVTIGSDEETIYMNSDSSFMFGSFSNLKEIKGLELLDTSNVTDMSSMFSNCSQLTTLDLSGWETSNVTDMSLMFLYCSQLTNLSFIQHWDTSSVTNMKNMFQSCGQLTSVGDLSGWDISNVTGMGAMFSGCSQLTSLNLNGWDTSSVTDMRGMFNGCSQLQSIDLSGWDTSSVTDVSWMFNECRQLSTTITIHGNIVNYEVMFNDAATADGTNITVNYTSANKSTVQEMVDTKSSSSHVYMADSPIPEFEVNIVGNENVTANPSSTYVGGTVILECNLENKAVSSFKLNGTQMSGNTFKMPEGGATITDIVLVEVTIFESNHNPYGDDLNQVFEKKFEGAKSLTLILNYETESIDYDYIEVYDSPDSYDSILYVGGEGTETLTIDGDYVKIVFVSDESGSDYYGFKATIIPNY